MLMAASLALIADTAPVAFGAIAVPITTLGTVTGLSTDKLGAMVGRQTPIQALFVPFVPFVSFVPFVLAGWSAGGAGCARCGRPPPASPRRSLCWGCLSRGTHDRGLGLGLGLAIARGLAEANDAQISVQNVSDGCRFSVLFAHPPPDARGSCMRPTAPGRPKEPEQQAGQRWTDCSFTTGTDTGAR